MFSKVNAKAGIIEAAFVPEISKGRGLLMDGLACCGVDSTEVPDSYQYARGMLVGMVTAMMACGMDLEKAVKEIVLLLPKQSNIMGKFDVLLIPLSWREEFAKHGIS